MRARRAAKSSRRNLAREIEEGVRALADERQGRRTLRTHEVEFRKAPKLTAAQIVRLRDRLNVSRPVLAAYLRTNVRTLENWEQGRAKPNAQAALLILLLQRYPDTVRRLARL